MHNRNKHTLHAYLSLANTKHWMSIDCSASSVWYQRRLHCFVWGFISESGKCPKVLSQGPHICTVYILCTLCRMLLPNFSVSSHATQLMQHLNTKTLFFVRSSPPIISIINIISIIIIIIIIPFYITFSLAPVRTGRRRQYWSRRSCTLILSPQSSSPWFCHQMVIVKIIIIVIKIEIRILDFWVV